MKYLKHKNMRDVCFRILEMKTKLPWQNQKVRGCWVNIAMGEPFLIGNSRGYAIETIELKDPENWKEYHDARSAKTVNEPS